MLAASLGRQEGAAGTFTQIVILTNMSGRTCTVRGYGGYGLVVAGSSALVEKVTRGINPIPRGWSRWLRPGTRTP